MDLQTGLICVALIVVSAVVILFVLLLGIKEKTYEEAIAEQRRLPDDLLLGKREKGKEKKHKNKAGKKVKEKKEEKEEKEEEKTEHVQFEDSPQIMTKDPPLQEEKNLKGNSKKKGKIEKVKPILINKDEPVLLAPESSPTHPQVEEVNHFNLTQPKDDLELVRSHSRENLNLLTQSEPIVNRSPRDTPTKLKKNVKEQTKKVSEIKEEKKEVGVIVNLPQQQTDKEISKEFKETQKETPVKEAKDITKDIVAPVQVAAKESKNKKKRNDILAQIGGDKDGVNISLLMPLVQKAELSRSEIQILIDQLLNKQLDNPLEHSEWTEGRADPVIKLKKQLAEKEKALADEQEASVAVQNKLKELRSELNAEKSRLSASLRQVDEALSTKITEVQTLHTRMQHILESHAAEKQGLARQIEQLQSKVNENMTIIHEMQEEQGQTQGHMQQELIAQRKQLEVQFAQMRDNENALKAQLAQKHAELQELQNHNITVNQEMQMLQSTYENSATEAEVLRQQLGMVSEQFIHSEGQLQHYKEAGERLQDMARQLEESHRTLSDLEHRLQNAHRHEQDIQKQLNSLKSELNVAKNEASEASSLKAELNKVQGELNKLKSDLSVSQNEAKTEAVEITSLKTEINAAQNDLKQSQSNLINVQNELKNSQSNNARIQKDLDNVQADLLKAQNEVKNTKNDLSKAQNDLSKIQAEFYTNHEDLKNAHQTISELRTLTVEVERLQQSEKKSSDTQIEVSRLQEENNRLSSESGAVIELQKEIRKLREENESLAAQLTANMHRPAAEGRENGVETKAVKNNVQLIEHSNLLAQKESLLNELKAEVLQKDTELNKLTVQLQALQSDINNERHQIGDLRDELAAQKTKNNELSQKVKLEEQKSTEALLQRIFPDMNISELSHEKWLYTFEQKVSTLLKDLKCNKDSSSMQQDFRKQNQSLQGMVTHYKQIIDDTEGMLNRLQNHVESEEARWQTQLRQKEETLAALKIELDDLRTKSGDSEKLKQKIFDLEARLSGADAFGQQTQAELSALQIKREPSSVKGAYNQSFAAFEQLGEDKSRLLQALHQESMNKSALDAEVSRLRSLLEKTESSLAEEKNLVSQLHQEVFQLKNEVHGSGSKSDQSTVNGPPLSDSTNSGGGSGKK